ncbi:hypothetical protein D9757_001503 [Collybiopsis confluens]|uniref:BTB domain-containing protein n=1 Tax=Collybiopsis confluens TaxID=2823264 RepID=A0A8H5HZE4_9AGAR|nr:hypothetical protein D9757_001503 [Collybiopsis confluens]
MRMGSTSSFSLAFNLAFKMTAKQVIIRSSDMVDFTMNKNNLEFFTGSFPSADACAESGDPIPLIESSKILQLLFEFVEQKPPPTLDGISFDDLLRLAEAAEKYIVYSALTICKIKLREFISSNPVEILTLAVKHNHSDLIVALYPLLMDKPLPEVAPILGSGSFQYFAHWSLQNSRWSEALNTATRSANDHGNCPWWGYNMAQILYQLDKPSRLTQPHLGDIFQNFLSNPHHNTCCRSAVSQWEADITAKVKDIPEFSLDLRLWGEDG